MTIAIVILAALTGLVIYREREMRSERERWEAERQTLLERIQRPERTPVMAPGPDREPLETDGPELALVGQILPEEDDSHTAEG